MNRFLLLSCLWVLPTYALDSLSVSSSQQKTAVVEFYTSEGCSSCPPADRWFGALTQLPQGEVDMLGLAFHVDYWDYLGWKDRFGSPRHSSRQRLLGANNRQNTIYTPEFFVNGVEARGVRNVIEKIRSSNREKAAFQLELSVTISSGELLLELRSNRPASMTAPLQRQFFVYENQLMSDVKRGENAGEQLKHQQVVRYMSPMQAFKKINKHSIGIDADWQLDQIGVAALVTSPGKDVYLQAVHTPISPLLSH